MNEDRFSWAHPEDENDAPRLFGVILGPPDEQERIFSTLSNRLETSSRLAFDALRAIEDVGYVLVPKPGPDPITTMDHRELSDWFDEAVQNRDWFTCERIAEEFDRRRKES
jgi:hypothetical protein